MIRDADNIKGMRIDVFLDMGYIIFNLKILDTYILLITPI